MIEILDTVQKHPRRDESYLAVIDPDKIGTVESVLQRSVLLQIRERGRLMMASPPQINEGLS